MNAEPRGRLSGVRVLVVEDVAAVRELIRTMLELEGATVVEAPTGAVACELASTQAFDVALTDLGLPDMSGEAVVTFIRSASRRRTPVAVVSGASDGRLARALTAGAERAFAKPVEWNELIRYLADRTAGRRSGAVRNRETTMKVLIVEDDDAMRKLLRDVLEREGHRVTERADGTELPPLAERERFDAVVLDKEMPGANGFDLLSVLRARRPAVPVIFITAFGGPQVAEEAARRGAFSSLEKPCRVAEIVDTLAAVQIHHLGVEPGSGA